MQKPKLENKAMGPAPTTKGGKPVPPKGKK